MTGRCMKCGEDREMKDPQESRTKNGRRMMKGKCKDCDTTVCVVLKNDA